MLFVGSDFSLILSIATARCSAGCSYMNLSSQAWAITTQMLTVTDKIANIAVRHYKWWYFSHTDSLEAYCLKKPDFYISLFEPDHSCVVTMYS